MYCVNITIWSCQLIGIDYGNEVCLKRRTAPGDAHSMIVLLFLTSHRVTIAERQIITIFGVGRVPTLEI